MLDCLFDNWMTLELQRRVAASVGFKAIHLGAVCLDGAEAKAANMWDAGGRAARAGWRQAWEQSPVASVATPAHLTFAGGGHFPLGN